MAINDMCQLENEPELHFPRAKKMFYWWLWNLRITYPDLEIYIADDDVSGAFRLVKYNPQLVALHSFVIGNWLFMNTGQTFGDLTSPPNWDPVAECRRLLARHLWKDPNIVARAAQFLPDGIELAPPPPPDTIAAFPKPKADSFNPGVLDAAGARIAPLYPHHVDDNCYADIAPFLGRTISASIIALYELLSYPDDMHFQDPLSRDKFVALYSHLRKVLGLMVNSRSLTVTLPDYKFDRIIAIIDQWLVRKSFTILDAASLVGQLIHASECCRWSRPVYFNLQNTLRRLILAEYSKVKSLAKRRKLNLSHRDLPPSLAKRIQGLIARQIASLVYRSRRPIPLNITVVQELLQLRSLFTDHRSDWSLFIGHAIPREPNFNDNTDASNLGAGGFSNTLHFWWSIEWSGVVQRALLLRANEVGNSHINYLEFLALIVQVAAFITIYESPEVPHFLRAHFPNGLPDLPVLCIWTDNKIARSWAAKISSKSLRGQQLVTIWAQLLRRTDAAIDIDYIPGEENTLADWLSRFFPFLHSNSSTLQTLLPDAAKHSWTFFRPSPELLSLLSSKLFCETWPALPELPKKLGQFETVDYTTSNFAIPTI